MRIRRQTTSYSTLVEPRMHPAVVASILLFFAAAGCSGVSAPFADPATVSTNKVVHSVPTTSQPAATLGRSEEQVTTTIDPPPAQDSDHQPSIRRADLMQVLKKGAQVFASRLRVRPAFHKGKFWGWHVLAYNGPGPIRVGDIVLRINDKEIEKPLQVIRVWEALGASSTLIVRIYRNGYPLTFRYLIEE